jgi:hypothetical protein
MADARTVHAGKSAFADAAAAAQSMLLLNCARPIECQKSMIIGLALFPYLIGGVVMWFVAHMVAPVGYTLSLSRGLFAVVLMACSGEVARCYLRPIVGDWCILAELAVPAAVGMVILQLPFRRSLLALLAYDIIVVAATIAVGFYVGHHLQ